MKSFYVPVIMVFMLFSCATSEQRKGSKSSGRYLISAEEIAQTTAKNAYEAIQLLRPNLLKYRGTRGRSVPIEPVVYVDNLRYGGMGSLSDISSVTIAQIQYLKATDATTRFGTNHMGGAFVVTTKSQ